MERKKDMINVLFVCHGNICRSPMAEYVCKDMVRRAGMTEKFRIASAATSREELGNPLHRGTQAVLRQHGIPFAQGCARQLTKAEYAAWDYLIGMDEQNLRNMQRLFGPDPEQKLFRLLDFTQAPRDVADPWYTGDFDTTYADVVRSCEAFLHFVQKK